MTEFSYSPSTSISALQVMAPDILLIIARQAATGNRLLAFSWDPKTILTLSHVCRHWRNALVSFPNLWNKMCLYSWREATFLDLLLTRSVDYPLEVEIMFNVHCFLSDDKFSRYCVSFSAHVHRIRTLIITIHGVPSWDDREGLSEISLQPFLDFIMSTLFKKSAPMLVSFNINSTDRDVQLHHRFFEDVAMTPNLKNLDAKGLWISCRLPILKRVTHVCLRNVRGFRTVSELIYLLEGASKSLEVLILCRLLGFEPILKPDHHHAPVQFSHLNTLHLDLEPEALMTVLGHITTPSRVNWRIDCYDALSKSNLDITPLLAFLNQVQTGPYLLIDWITDGHVYLQFSQDYFSPPNVTLRSKLGTNSKRDPPFNAKESIHRLKSLFTSLHLSEVYFCEIDCRRLESKEKYMEDYCKIFGSLLLPFLHLEKLVIRLRNEEVFYQFASHLQPVAFGTSISSLPCPLLNDLRISPVNAKFDMGMEKLTKILVVREKASGHVLKNLHIGVSSSLNYYDCQWKNQYDILPRIFENLAENIDVYDDPSYFNSFQQDIEDCRKEYI